MATDTRTNEARAAETAVMELAAIEDLSTSLDEAEEWTPRCPECGSERIAERVAFNAEPHGERSEQVYMECLNCGEKFEEGEAWL